MVGSKRCALRLDDGTLIGSGLDDALGGGVCKLSFQRAVDVNRGSEKDLQRLEALLATAQKVVPAAAVAQPVANNGNTYSSPMNVPSKRARVDSGHLDGIVLGGDWVSKCSVILDKIAKCLGQHKNVFWNAVNPSFLPDYYPLIKNPMFFGTVEDRLTKQKYTSPHEFHADLKLGFANCKLYNPVNDPYRKLGEKAEVQFDQLWVASGLADTETMEARGKRATAGIARPKYEPEKFEGPSNSKPHSGGKAPNKGKAKASHEVTSGGRAARELLPVSETRKHEMAELLCSDDFAPHMEALTQVLPPEMLEGADGEFELDFEALDNDTIRKIDVFLRNIFGPPAGEAASGAVAASPASAEEEEEEVSEAELDDSEDSDDD